MIGLRNHLLLWLGLILMASCHQEFKTLKGTSYQVSGEVANCEGCEVKLQLYDYNRFKTVEQLPIQIDTVKNGRFLIKGRMNRAGFYEIHIKDQPTNRSAGVKIYLPSEPIHITANLDGLSKGKLQRFNTRDFSGAFTYMTATSSSPVQQEITRYFLLVDSLTAAYYHKQHLTLEAFRKTFTSGNRDLVNQWGDSVRNFPHKYAFFRAHAADLFIRRHPRSEVAILAMLDNHHERTTNYRFNQYLKALSPVQQTSYYGQILIKKLTLPDKPLKYKQHWVGGSITYLKGKTPAGKDLDVLKVFQRNKLTLVSFWASWNGPSRWQMPDYKKLYRENRGQGFEIIAVSFDRDHAAWTKAIAEEGLAFKHVSELKGEKAEEYKRFRIRDIPFNILFDEKGTMVGVDMSPKELEAKLQQYFRASAGIPKADKSGKKHPS